jgi:hypothetical protein
VNGYTLRPSEQDMISAAGIKDQELTIIVSMMVIELALLRLSRAAFFKRLARRCGKKREQDHRIAVSHDDFARRPRVITRHMSGANQLGLRSR